MNMQRAASWCTWSDLNDWNYQKPKWPKARTTWKLEQFENWNSLKARTTRKLEQPESWNAWKLDLPENWNNLKAWKTWKLEQPDSWNDRNNSLPASSFHQLNAQIQILTICTVKKAVELLDAPSKNTLLKSNKYNSIVEIFYLDTLVFFSPLCNRMRKFDIREVQ